MAFSHGKAATAGGGQTLLGTAEAAALLQPHMRAKHALDWLLSDRKHDPLIPFLVTAEGIRYRPADVTDFILRFLDPGARFARAGRCCITERRRRANRRNNAERRRGNVEGPMPAAERRLRGELDRRLRGELDRRAAD